MFSGLDSLPTKPSFTLIRASVDSSSNERPSPAAFSCPRLQRAGFSLCHASGSPLGAQLGQKSAALAHPWASSILEANPPRIPAWSIGLLAIALAIERQA